MKKINIVILLITFVYVSIAQNWVEFSASESTLPQYNILQSNNAMVEIEINVPGMWSSLVDSLNRIQIKEQAKLDSIGFPELPIISYLIAIPECEGVNLQYELLDSTLFSEYNIYPAPELVADTTENGGIALVEQFAYNRPFYESDTWFPGKYIETIGKGAIRSQNVIRIQFYPIQFNPSKNEIWTYSKAKVTLTFTNPTENINEDVGIFNEVVGNTLINYASNGLNASISCGKGIIESGNVYRDSLLTNQKLVDSCDYLIITPDDFFYDEKLWELANHRANFNGFDVVITRLSSIYNSMPDTLSYVDRIRNLIQNTYNSNSANNTYDGKLAYVNLFGDVILDNGNYGVPTHNIDESHGGYDVYFTQLTCDTINGQVVYDDYPDIMIGRMSVGNSVEVDNVVHKVLHFKPEDLDYKHEMLTIASSYEFYSLQSDVMMAMDEVLPDYYHKEMMLDPGFNKPHPDWDSIPYGADSLLKSWNEGKMFVSYMDHGYLSGWGNPQFSWYDSINLAEHKLPFVLSTACKTGKFQISPPYNDCMAEKFLCYDSLRGAIGMLASSIETYSSTFHFNTLYFNSVFNNYSLVLGESILESKLLINNYGSYGLLDYNLFGDPAMNILYENTEEVLPDIVAKLSEIKISPEYPSITESMIIETKIKNITWKNTTADFYVSCFVVDIVENDTLWVGNTLLSGMDGYSQAILEFTIPPNSLQSSTYDIFINVDTADVIMEMNEDNNLSIVKRRVFNYETNMHIFSQNAYQSSLICFDIDPSYSGEEIILGDKIFSANGEVISNNEMISKSYTTVGNLTNDNQFQVLQTGYDTTSSKIICTGTPSWSQILSINNNEGPFVFDFDDDGDEEVFLVENDNQNYTYSIRCFNSDGESRWNYNTPQNLTIFTPVAVHHSSFDLLFIDDFGVINLLKENASKDSLLLVDTIQISGGDFYYQIFPPILTDISKDNVGKVIFQTFGYIYGIKINVLDLNTFEIESKELVNDGEYTKPIVSDINNDGISEIILAKRNVGLLILNSALDTLLFLERSNMTIANIVSGDFNNDGKNDIVFQTKEVNLNSIEIVSGTGDLITKSPLVDSFKHAWISDYNKDGKNELLYKSSKDLFIVSFPNAGSSIGFPGQRGNIRNTGVLSQPAYYPADGETIYWSGKISLSPNVDNIILPHAKIIIKPGTRIEAHSGAELIVQGQLIAEGTENHPIRFLADINGANKGYWQGITVANHARVSMKYCEVKDAAMGVLAEDNSNLTIQNCTIQNNIEGISAFNSEPVIKECFITDNDNGIHSYKHASPVLTDVKQGQPFGNGIINNAIGINISNANVHLDNGGNDIYNSPQSGYYVKLSSDYSFYYVNAAKNYWGDTDVNKIKTFLDPANSILIEPILTSPQSPYSPNSSGKALMLKEATVAQEEQNYSTAIDIYHNIIAQYPDSEEASLSVSGLFEATRLSSGDMNSLASFYHDLYTDTTQSIKFQKLAYSYLNLCKRAEEKYSEAIANYESILLNNPTHNDSVFAVIDIGNTYKEAGNGKSATGQLAYLNPKSVKAHVANTVNLLLSLKPEEQIPEIEEGIKGFVLGQNYPNPFDNSTTISYFTPSTSAIVLEVLDMLGRKVLRKEEGVKPNGFQNLKLNLNGFPPGVYYYVLRADNEIVGIRKMILK